VTCLTHNGKYSGQITGPSGMRYTDITARLLTVVCELKKYPYAADVVSLCTCVNDTLLGLIKLVSLPSSEVQRNHSEQEGNPSP